MNKTMVITIVLAVLLLVAVVQTVQLVSIKSKLSSGVSVASVKTSAGAPSVGGSDDLNNLNTMVGGC